MTLVVSRDQDHPRIRGEHTRPTSIKAICSGSSPHTRGARLAPGRPNCVMRIIPAYAGSTTSATSPRSSAPDHPRIRGEHLAHQLIGDRRVGIIPAYAGSTNTDPAPTPAAGDHPRIRGEHADGPCVRFSGPGSSPHTRGAPSESLPTSGLRRIIPAYAGSTAAPMEM